MDLPTGIGLFLGIVALGVTVTPGIQNWWVATIAWLAAGGWAVWLIRSHRGQILRAISDNPRLTALLVCGLIVLVAVGVWLNYIVPYAQRQVARQALVALTTPPAAGVGGRPAADQPPEPKPSPTAPAPRGGTAPATNVTVNAPQGIAIGGGTVTNPSVTNIVVPNPQRQITDEQAAQLVERLRPLAGPKVLIRLNQANNEMAQFGMRLAQVLRAAGITVTDIQSVMSFGPPGPIPTIAFVVDRTATGQERLALTLGETLVAMKIVSAPYGVNPPDSKGNPEFLIIDIFPLG